MGDLYSASVQFNCDLFVLRDLHLDLRFELVFGQLTMCSQECLQFI